MALLAGIVLAAHHPAVFMALFLLCLGIRHAYPYQKPVGSREALLAGILAVWSFWWFAIVVQPLLEQMLWAMFWGAMGLTAVTDNAAITYPRRTGARFVRWPRMLMAVRYGGA